MREEKHMEAVVGPNVGGKFLQLFIDEAVNHQSLN